MSLTRRSNTRRGGLALSALVLLLVSTAVQAMDTRVMVRVRAGDAKFIGSHMGGMSVVITDIDSGRTLASGMIKGGTGNTAALMMQPQTRGVSPADTGTAGFLATLSLDRPTHIAIHVHGPLKHPENAQDASVTTWIIPGKDIVGDGIVINMPGLSVTPLPVSWTDKGMEIAADVTMMCGCTIAAGGPWPAKDFQVGARISRGGRLLLEVPLMFSGQPNRFVGHVNMTDGGQYRVEFWAWQPHTGNTGVATTEVTRP